MQSGPLGVAKLRTTESLSMSMIETVLAARLDTKRCFLSPIGAKACAPSPVLMVPTVLRARQSITST